MKTKWSVIRRHPILMVPGPTELSDRVRQRMSEPAIVQYDLDYNGNVLDPICQRLEKLFGKPGGHFYVMPGSGRTALESGALSMLRAGDPCVVINAGFFGEMMLQIAQRSGAEVHELKVPWGKPIDLDALRALVKTAKPRLVTLVHNETSSGSMYPLEPVQQIAAEVDALVAADTVSSFGGAPSVRDGEVALSMTASQKCLGAPVGLGIVYVSADAQVRMKSRDTRSVTWANDLRRWNEEWLSDSAGGGVAPGVFRMQPVGIPSHLVAALDAALEEIEAEGVANRFARHRLSARAVCEGLSALGFEPFADKTLLSPTVSCLRVPAGVRATEVVGYLRAAYGIQIATGMREHVDTTIRIGTMASTASPHYVLPTLGAIEAALTHLGRSVVPGAAMSAAQAVFLRDEHEHEKK